jgi:hypothetical protein
VSVLGGFGVGVNGCSAGCVSVDGGVPEAAGCLPAGGGVTVRKRRSSSPAFSFSAVLVGAGVVD